jgi:hypothetical protein
MRLTPLVAAAALLGAGCNSDSPLVAPDTRLEAARVGSPAGLVTVATPAGSVAFFPYLNDNLTDTSYDPVNLVFTGHADPRNIRAALLGLSGTRGQYGFPAVAPFDCVWSDAIGGLMAGFGRESGWAGAAIQLQCGGFGPMRFHLRLVDIGTTTIANVHFEVLIPGTTDHQVLSWELAEQLVTADLARSGLLSQPPSPTATITTAPPRTIPEIIYNALPAALTGLVGGPTAPVSSPVPIADDGRATQFVVGGVASPRGGTTQEFTIDFDQVIPRPFCATGQNDFIEVKGPIRFRQTVTDGPEGNLVSKVAIEGSISVAPFDPSSPTGFGPPHQATVSETQTNTVGARGGSIQGRLYQVELPRRASGNGELTVTIKVAPKTTPRYDRRVVCTP